MHPYTGRGCRLCHVTKWDCSLLQRFCVRPVDVTVCVGGQGAVPDGTVTDLGEVDGAFAGCVAFPGTAPAGQANLLAGVQIGEIAEQAHVLAPGAMIKAQAECPGLFGALVLLQVGFHAFFIRGQNSIGIHSLCPFCDRVVIVLPGGRRVAAPGRSTVGCSPAYV